jgi:hypothetical protein
VPDAGMNSRRRTMYKFVIVALLTLLPWSTQAALPDFQPIVESAAPAVVKILVE